MNGNPCLKRKHALNALRVGWMEGTAHCTSSPGRNLFFLFLGLADERALGVGRPVAGIF